MGGRFFALLKTETLGLASCWDRELVGGDEETGVNGSVDDLLSACVVRVRLEKRIETSTLEKCTSTR
jgi:hypothetical protein